jgi:hypothetical protein
MGVREEARKKVKEGVEEYKRDDLKEASTLESLHSYQTGYFGQPCIERQKLSDFT